MASRPSQDKASIWSRLWALLFIAFMLGLMIWAALNQTKLSASISRDPLALLPLGQQTHSPQDNQLIQKALDYQSKYISDKLIFFVYADTPEQTATAVQQLKTAWAGPNSPLRANPLHTPESQQQFLEFYVPHQQHILTTEQAQKYQTWTDQQWAEEVMSNVSRPVSIGLSVKQDPMGNLQSWLLQQMSKSPLQQNAEGDSQIEYKDKLYTVLFYSAVDSTFSLDTEHSVLNAYNDAKAQVLAQNPNAIVMAAGIPMHAAAAAAQASKEMSTFGTISTIAIVILTTLGFMRLRAVLLIALSLFVGFVTAYMATYAWFGQVHVVTLVFGSSLIGVAEDYGLHFLAARQHASGESPWQVRKHVMMGLVLALLTTALAYACLGFPPFPGLRQIAVFSVMGLTGSWLTVVLLFPFLGGQMGQNTWLSRMFANMWLWWLNAPRLGWIGKVFLTVLFVPVIFGLFRLQFKDDLRTLQNSPQWLINEQMQIGEALNESNTQFILVTADTEQALLEREEWVRMVLDEQVTAQHLGNYRAVSEWLPSVAAQKNNEQVILPKLKHVSQLVGMQVDSVTVEQGRYLMPEHWLKQPIAQVVKAQWLGQQDDGRWASMISLHGKMDDIAIAQFKALEKQDEHVLFVNSVADYSNLMSTYRNKILWLLGVAYLGTVLLLWLRYRRQAILIIMPPLLASMITLGICGLLGVPLQLFTALPLLLILGMGVDYGIFLVEHADEQAHTWMTICLSTMSTILSLGLMMFSSTPALHLLGLSLGIGMTFAWLIAGFMGRYVYVWQVRNKR